MIRQIRRHQARQLVRLDLVAVVGEQELVSSICACWARVFWAPPNMVSRLDRLDLKIDGDYGHLMIWPHGACRRRPVIARGLNSSAQTR